MKKILISLALTVAVIGCTSAKRVVYNTLASTQTTTTAAYDGYLDLVVKGKLTTNSLPSVAKKYNAFQNAWNAALIVAQFNPSTPVTPDVQAASSSVLTEIKEAK